MTLRRTNLLPWIGALVLLLLAACALLAGWLFPEDPMEMVAAPYLWPGTDAAFPLGSDLMGRDLLAGIVHGARVSLVVGASSAAFAVVVGLLVGALGGYFGGWLDAALMRLVELFQTLPSFLLAILLVAALQPSVGTIVLALGLTGWTDIARLVRSEFIGLRHREFVLAARAQGATHARLVLREILPNALTPVAASLAILVAHAILAEAALSFLGLGDPNHVSWGGMIGTGREALRTAWYMTAIPGAAVVVTVLALNAVSDGIARWLNPKLRALP